MGKTVSYRRRAEEGALTLSGVADIFEAGILRDAALRALGDEKALVLRLDLSHVERLDVSALQILCALRRDLEAQGRSLVSGAVPAGVEALQTRIGCAL